ncbi:hypothetical protein PINS_up018744 [Pythium insidiosum]|nr:hypothetical protein PINS_up018744 [Pythium insidiosum]
MQRSVIRSVARAAASASARGASERRQRSDRRARSSLVARYRATAQSVVSLARGFSTSEHVGNDQDNRGSDSSAKLLSMDVQHRDYIALKWSDGRNSKYHLLHLRSWCLCPACQHETGQRLVNSADVAEDLEIRDMFVKGETLTIVWGPDGHQSTFPWAWLRENCYSTAALDRRARDMATIPLLPGAPIPEIAYDRMMENDEGLLEMLHQVVEHGFTVIKNTPSEPRQVKKVAERVAPVSHSFLYGDVFDVIAEQNPVNIAYTNHHLKHHLDLAYYESPPGFQLLHALRFDETVQGGESTFVDVFAVAEAFRQQHPDHFLTFCRVPATFKKHHLNRSNPAVMEYQRPHIQLNHREEVIAVHWSPPFEGPLRVPFDDVQAYYAAYRVFHDLVEGGSFQGPIQAAARRYCDVQPEKSSSRPQPLLARVERCAPPAGHVHQHRRRAVSLQRAALPLRSRQRDHQEPPRRER